jgi:rhodanese-related sulfurtransferase
MSNQTITIAPAEASALVSGGHGTLVDVRTTAEFREIHAQGAQLVPLDVLDRKAVEAARGANAGPLYLLCASGIRATKAAEKLKRAGLDDAIVVEGGTNAWAAAGLPVIRGRKAISIERQVRIGAGCFVLAARRWAGLSIRDFTCSLLSLVRAWSLPESPTFAAWPSCWPGRHGTGPARNRTPPSKPATPAPHNPCQL